jgi:hypothetical protein
VVDWREKDKEKSNWPSGWSGVITPPADPKPAEA